MTQSSPVPRPPRSRVAGRSLRDRAGRAVRDSATPGDLVALWQGNDGVDQRTARAVIDLAIRVGETLLSTGLTTLLGAAGIGMGLAAGVSMGTYLMGVTGPRS